MAKRPAVFLDRDGVINPLIYHRDAGIVDSPFTLAQFQVERGVPEAIRLLNDLGFAVVVVSNQPGVAKAHFGRDLLPRQEAKLRASLAPFGARIDAFYYCLHHPEAVVKSLRKRCACRKPAPGMLRKAAKELGLSLAESYMIGDGLTDIEAGYRAGCRTVFVGRWKCEHCQFIRPRRLRPKFVAKNLRQAARLLRAQLRQDRRTGKAAPKSR
jgi:D-glycero-D-manno-heptose 1,7-bisphosphate phosphatase